VIVADTNLIVYLLIPGGQTHQAERVFARDPEWSAPLLWQSEFRNSLAFYIRRGLLSLDEALRLMQRAETLMQGKEYEVSSTSVLNLATGSRCSAYDCEFVALAQDLGVPLVTSDTQVLSAFPSAAVSAGTFGLTQ
jgi:predicted nucleic acid-binding protein